MPTKLELCGLIQAVMLGLVFGCYQFCILPWNFTVLSEVFLGFSLFFLGCAGQIPCLSTSSFNTASNSLFTFIQLSNIVWSGLLRVAK